MRESEVVSNFVRWLEGDGWHVQTEQNGADVVATRAGRRLICEAKGTTRDRGLDTDTAYGQLLRRITDDPVTTYALVVPRHSERAAARVDRSVRDQLHIAVYLVGDTGEVAEMEI